jgi:Zn-dependent metalloprotease
MKKTDLLLGSLSLFCTLTSFSQTFIGKDAESKIQDAQQIEYSEHLSKPKFIEFNASPSNFRMAVSNPLETMKAILALGANDNLVSYRKENDDIGYTHTRYQQVYKNIPVEGGTYIAHQKSGVLNCINGLFFTIGDISVTPALNESAALASALKFVGAKKYKWENKAELAALREAFNDPNYNYDPKGSLVIYPKNNELSDKADFRLAYKFNIYADEPESRANIFVDAHTGEILGRQELIMTADVTGTANTKYSGTQSIKTTLKAGDYVLQEVTRGSGSTGAGGIKTYNAHTQVETSTNLGTQDFTDADNVWNNVNPQWDEAATDAHWATEMTWDFYSKTFNRNSVDNKGFTLINYVHCGTAWFNANWNGSFMRYGDGPANVGKPLTAIDIGAHEMTHGVTGATAALVYQGESGALNESFSDIFGSCVEWFAKPAVADWLMGGDIGALRDMQYPKRFSNPDTYKGQYWASTTDNTTTGDNGGVHTNSGVQNHWFFILVNGETGTNDNNLKYAVSGIGLDEAQKIAYRNLSFYMSANNQYTDARTNSLKAASELYGNCSKEYVAVAHAWDAVGVTGTITCSVAPSAGFVANKTWSCDGTIQFTDLSSETPTSWSWDFGDGQTSTTQNPSHTYTTSGTYDVTLTSTNSFGSSSPTKRTKFIVVSLPTVPGITGASRCGPGVVNLSATNPNSGSVLNWYAALSGGSSINTGTTYAPNLTNTTTYYVQSEIVDNPQHLGPTDSATLSRGGFFTANFVHGLYFNALAPVLIKSVQVYAGSAGIRTIEVDDVHGELITSANVNIPAGKSRVTLNFDLAPGNQYFLKVTGTLLNLQRAKGGASYPYTISNLISITETDIAATAPGSYYFFYDWEVSPSGCPSARVPVTGTINPDVAKPTITETAKVLSAPAGTGYTYQWYKDGQLIAGATNQTYKPTQDGSYTVKITNASSCSATSDSYPYLVNGIGTNVLDAAVRIYPNPASEAIYIEAPLNGSNVINLQVYSVIGKLVYQETYTNNGQAHLVNVSGIAADGIYFIKLQSGAESITRKITLSH